MIGRTPQTFHPRTGASLLPSHIPHSNFAVDETEAEYIEPQAPNLSRDPDHPANFPSSVEYIRAMEAKLRTLRSPTYANDVPVSNELLQWGEKWVEKTTPISVNGQRVNLHGALKVDAEGDPWFDLRVTIPHPPQNEEIQVEGDFLVIRSSGGVECVDAKTIVGVKSAAGGGCEIFAYPLMNGEPKVFQVRAKIGEVLAAVDLARAIRLPSTPPQPVQPTPPAPVPSTNGTTNSTKKG